MAKTNFELVEFVKTRLTSIANTWYFWNGTGQILTEYMINTSSYYADKPEYREILRQHIGAQVYDCAGLVDAFLAQNKRARDYYYAAIVKGSTSELPETPGIMVFNADLTHTGIYIGNGQVIEAMGTKYGVVQTVFDTNRWKLWAKCAQIDYVEPVPPRPSNPYPIPTYTLYKGKIGMNKNYVRWLQFELNWRYGDEIKIDGSFGPITDKWLRHFQDIAGLTVDGNCGALTRTKLVTTIK